MTSEEDVTWHPEILINRITLTTEQLISLDRQAILGRLSAGLVHAINNVLSGVIGQVDLLMLLDGGTQLKTDLEQIAHSCDEGVQLTKSLTRVIAALQDEGNLDPVSSLSATTHLLGRIYRRAGLKAELVTNGQISPANHGNIFLQSAFHLALLAFDDTASRNLADDERMPIQLELGSDHNNLTLTFPALEIPESFPTELPAQLTGKKYHFYIIGKLLDHCSAEIRHETADDRITLLWPISGKKL